MIPTPDYVKKYNSAKRRFLKGALDGFFRREFPQLMGPILREKLVDELLKLLDKTLPMKEHLKPGQMVWNAVSTSTRATSLNPECVPVVLTMIDEGDVEELVQGKKMTEIMRKAISRILNEAYNQGGLLSMRDIGLLTWRPGTNISAVRKKYEKENDCMLPHRGSLQDMGTCISHKAIIVRKVVLEKKDPYTVSRETKHSMRAVDRYLKDFHRVRTCYEDGKDEEFILLATGLSKHLVREYMRLIDNLQQKEIEDDYADTNMAT